MGRSLSAMATVCALPGKVCLRQIGLCVYDSCIHPAKASPMSGKSREGKKLGQRFEKALVFATRLHSGQKRKGREVPYVAHLLGVAALVLEHGGDEDTVIAALLHDAVEDQGGAVIREAIRKEFGERVVEIVNGCTDADTTPKPDWWKRKEVYIEHLFHEAGKDVRLVSLADKLHNARAILMDLRENGEALWERFNGGKDGTLWYYRELNEVFQETAPGPLADELQRVTDEIMQLACRHHSSSEFRQ